MLAMHRAACKAIVTYSTAARVGQAAATRRRQSR